MVTHEEVDHFVYAIFSTLTHRVRGDRMGQDLKLDVKLIDESLVGRFTVEEVAGENGLLKQLTKGILESALAAELTAHLGY